MPKKKKAAGGSKKSSKTGSKTDKKGSKDKKSSKDKASDSVENVGPTQLEISLQLELKRLEDELHHVRDEVESARKQHEYLLAEVGRADDETKDYEGYMTKLTMKEQSKVESMSDMHRRELDTIENETKAKAAEYARIKEELKETILHCDAEASANESQLNNMTDLKMLREKQEKEIKSLQDEIQQLSEHHTQELQKLKAKCLDERIEFQKNTANVVAEVEQMAAKEAFGCLDQHSARVKRENQQLRRQLLDVIAANRKLHDRQEMLQRQNKELQHQTELSQTLATARLNKTGRRSTSSSLLS